MRECGVTHRLPQQSFKTNKTPSDGGDYRTGGGDTNLTVVSGLIKT